MNTEAPILPLDQHNQRLLANVRPSGWRNPPPANRYNLVVLGAGTAGLVTAAGAAALGAKVALVEKHLMGGDCLNVGCVPSKTLLHAARVAHAARRGGPGIVARDVTVNFGAVMDRVRSVRAAISAHDSAERFRGLGVDVFLGAGRFISGDAIDVDGATLRFKRAVICTGARAAMPDIPGLAAAGFLTNETVFNLTTLPRRLAVIGGGPLGCELAQAFQRLGSSVTIFHNQAHLLAHEDPDAVQLLETAFRREGIQIFAHASISAVDVSPGGKTVRYDVGRAGSATFDEILVAAGRRPNVADLGLDEAGVEHDMTSGVRVDDRLRTTNQRIYAAGDVCLKWKFTHAADAAARLVIQNALFFGRKRVSKLVIPRCTYTDPEMAHVGMSAGEAQDRGVLHQVFTQPLTNVDRAITDDRTPGLVKLIVREGSGTILGATIVGPHAGDLIAEVAVAMKATLRLGGLARVIHPYPTLADAVRQCGDAWNRTRLTPGLRSWLSRWFEWRR